MLLSSIILVMILGFAAGTDLFLRSLFQNMPSPKVRVQVATLQNESWDDWVKTSGRLINREENAIRSLVSAPIQNIYIKMGDVVEEGQLLLSLDPRSAQARLFEAKAGLNYAQYRFDQDQKLYDQHSLSEVKYQQSIFELNQAFARIAQAQDALDDFQIRAPRSGVVGYMPWNIGDTVLLGEEVTHLWEPQSQRVRFSLGSHYHHKITPGQPMTVTLPNGDHASATIEQVAPALSLPQQRFWVEAVLDSTLELPPGTEVTVHIALPRDEPVLVVPIAALDTNALGPLIWVVHPQSSNPSSLTATAYPVRVIAEHHGMVAIEHEQLTQGAQVAVLGQFKLRPGQEVILDES